MRDDAGSGADLWVYRCGDEHVHGASLSLEGSQLDLQLRQIVVLVLRVKAQPRDCAVYIVAERRPRMFINDRVIPRSVLAAKERSHLNLPQKMDLVTYWKTVKPLF